MKYLKANSGNDHNRILAGEMINIMHGANYYIDGVLQDKPKKTNIYTIGTVSYTVYPNMGIVYTMMHIDHNAILGIMTQMISDASLTLMVSSALPGTTRYMSICLESPAPYSIIIYVNENISVQTAYSKNTSTFKWFIYTSLTDRYAPIYIPNLTKINSLAGGKESFRDSLITLSLSSIIYDTSNIFNLAHNTLSIDYPALSSYTKSSHICTEPITISLVAGIDLEIAKHYTTLSKKTLCVASGAPQIFMLEWDSANIKHIDVNVNLEVQLANASLLHNYIDTDYRCALTNCKIYDDCYIFDIYQQTISKFENKSTKKLPMGKSGKNIPTTIEIKTVVKYDKPVRFLISPYAMHFKQYTNGTINWFKNISKSDIIVYRTKCPITRELVIKSLDKPRSYIDMLLAFNKQPRITKNALESKYLSKRYFLVRDLSINDVLECVDNVIVGRYKL